MRERGARIAVACLLAAALAGPFVAPYDPLASDAAARLTAPSLAHPFGTDQLGRDVFSRVLAAAPLDLGLALGAVALSIAVGAPLGAAIGFVGGRLERYAARLVDALAAFPLFVLAMGIVAALGASLASVALATAAVNLPFYIRLARAEASVLRQAGFVEAARVGGSGEARILRRFILPALAPTLVAPAAVNCGWAMLNAAALSFLGLGVKPPTPEWGVMVAEGAQYVLSGRWWIALFPGLALTLATLAFGAAGDTLGARLGVRLGVRLGARGAA
jgi:peptide/nickel transport system permease protein